MTLTKLYFNSNGGFREEYLHVKYPEFAGGAVAIGSALQSSRQSCGLIPGQREYVAPGLTGESKDGVVPASIKSNGGRW